MYFDLIVIGGGSGGVRAARMAAEAGRKVALIEESRYGGTCVIRGCVPKKLLSYAAHYGEDLHDAAGYGWQLGSRPRFDWQQLMAAKNKEIDRLESVYRDTLLKSKGVQTFNGRGRLLGESKVRVGDQILSAECILIAVGGRPATPDIEGSEFAITSSEALDLPELPETMVVYGGGYIAVEFAGIFNGLGVQTHLIYRGDSVLRGFDADLRIALMEQMRLKGLHLHMERQIARLDANTVMLDDGSKIKAQTCLFATGRIPNTQNLGLEVAGVEVDARGAIHVDEYFKTSVAGIYALGDVIARVQLTPVAINEAMAFLDGFLHDKPRAMDYRTIPSAVFSDPNIATVGLSQEQAEQQGYSVRIYRSNFRAMKHILPDRPEKMLMKLIVDDASDKVLGLHIMGADAAEIVQGFAVAIKAGVCKRDFDATVGIHPSAAEELVTMRVPL